MAIGSEEAALGFVCTEIDGGWSWTITSRLEQLLAEAEARYGPRDPTYTILGVEFGGGIPCVWYPGDRKDISIKLTHSAKDNPRQAIFQLAHEVIHLLAPGSHRANVLEEGLATMFADEMSLHLRAGFQTDVASYQDAKRLVMSMLAVSPDSIRKLRLMEPSFHNFTPELVKSVLPPDYALGEIGQLCGTFLR